MIQRRGSSWWTSSKKGKFDLFALTETKLKGEGGIMGLTDDVQGGFRAGKGCGDCRSDLHPKGDIGVKAPEKNLECLYIGFMGLEKAYDRVNREPL